MRAALLAGAMPAQQSFRASLLQKPIGKETYEDENRPNGSARVFWLRIGRVFARGRVTIRCNSLRVVVQH